MNNNSVIIDFVRTPIGAVGGSLSSVESYDLAAICIAAIIQRTKLNPSNIEQIIFGQARPTTFPSNVARYAALMCDIPEEIPAYTIQKACASSMQALANAHYLIKTKQSKFCIAGGTESFSALPFVIRNARYQYEPYNNPVIDTIVEAETSTQPKLLSPQQIIDEITTKYGYIEADLLKASYLSYQKAGQAIKQNIWNSHLEYIKIFNRKHGELVIKDDEILINYSSSLVSSYGDGAAAMLITSMDEAINYSLTPLASIEHFTSIGCDPEDYWLGGFLALEKLCKLKKLDFRDIDLISIQEDSAAYSLANLEKLSLLFNQSMDLIQSKTNLYGGSLAYGKTVGADGILLVAQLILGLKNSGGKLGIAATSVAGGQGMAVLIKLI